MEIIPAIDLLDGWVVRLAEGDFARATIYSGDPVAVARKWVGQGANRIHIVDLDGARAGRRIQGDVVARIVAAVKVPCQVAGGIRTEADATEALAAGADRVVLGTALLDSPQLAGELVARHGRRIAAAIDVRGGRAVGGGWQGSDAGVNALDVLVRLRDAGIAWFAVTAIERDGSQEGPDLGLLDEAATIVPAASIIASAGIGCIDDVRTLAARGFGGAILGRALYEGTLTLADALAAS